MIKENKVLFNFRMHKELYDYVSIVSKERYTTMTQYLIDLIKKDKDSYRGGGYYVYVYLDPRKSGEYAYDDLDFEYEPFYVGKGKGDRINQSLYDNNNNTDKKRIISEILGMGMKPITIKIYDNISNEKSYELERELIQRIGRLNEGSVLVNRSKGSTCRKSNLDVDINELYQSKLNENNIISVVGSDDTFFELSDGSRMSKIMFYHNFKGFELVDPQDFFSSTPASTIVDAVKKMDEGVIESVKVDIPDELKKQSNYTPDKDRITTDKYFNNGPESIKRYTGSLISDKQKLKLSNDLEKYRSTIKKLTKKQNTEDTLFGLRELSRNFKKYITENGYIMQHEFDENLTISKDIRLLIDIDNKGLMNEEILYRLKSITKS